ncbi:MAG: DUF1566 domain-containing protein [SAR324 cluster bacterium]|nr:DUF1566 domain-containing protein [SAR324 cluster bacterium]
MYRYSGNAPTVSSTSPADGGSWIPGQSTGWVVNFSQAMSTSTITTNTSDTTCSGSVQVSSDSFSTCVRMSAAPVASNSNYSFTLTPYASLTGGTTYKIRVTTGAQSSGGTALASTWTHSTGILVTVPVPDTGQTTSYTTTFGEDHDYTTHTPSYTDNGNSTVTDNVTGLMWQKEDDGSTRTWDNAGTYCSGLSLGGYSDWRLPTPRELQSIVSYGTYNPAINGTYFPNTQNNRYWSSMSYINNSTHAWYLSTQKGEINRDVKSTTSYVRCVRGGTSSGIWTVNYLSENSTVQDLATGLMWQKVDDGSARSKDQGLNYCESLALENFTDWRLPDIKELESIVDYSSYNPAINTSYFSNTQTSAYYMSSTSDVSNSLATWRIHFGEGYFGPDNSSGLVRCVRGGL